MKPSLLSSDLKVSHSINESWIGLKSSSDWVKKWVDIEHHLAEPDPDAEPPKFVKFIRGGASLVGIELSPYFTSTQVVIDFAGTFLIYGTDSIKKIKLD